MNLIKREVYVMTDDDGYRADIPFYAPKTDNRDAWFAKPDVFELESLVDRIDTTDYTIDDIPDAKLAEIFVDWVYNDARDENKRFQIEEAVVEENAFGVPRNIYIKI